MFIQGSGLFHSKISNKLLGQDSQSFCSFGRFKNVGDPGLLKKNFSISLAKDFIFQFHVHFS